VSEDASADPLNRIATILLSELSSTGLHPLEEVWHPESFGSGMIVFGRSKPELRLVWEGRDGWAWLQALRSSFEWVDIAGPMKQGDFPSGVPDAEKLVQMVDAARRALA
jgi:hypothetical protein